MCQFIRICLCLILLHCAVTSGSDDSSSSDKGNCRYPDEYYPPKEWLYAYDSSKPGEGIVKQTFSKSSRTLNASDEYVCVDSEKDKQTVYTVSSISADGQLQYQCTEHIFYDNGMILQRESDLMPSQPTTEQCVGIIQPQEWFRVLFEYQETGGAFDVPTMDCPFPEGTFKLTMNWYSREGFCENADIQNSYGVVSGSSLYLQLCAEFLNLAYDLVCHQRIPPTDLGEPDNSKGDIIIASRYFPVAPYRVFYCFHYKVEEDKNTFYVASVVRTLQSIECSKDWTYNTYGVPGVIAPAAFIFKR